MGPRKKVPLLLRLKLCIFQLKTKRYIGYATYKYFAHDVLMNPKLLRSLIIVISV